MSDKTNILIVENDGIIAKDMEKTLEKFGYTVSALVFSGEEAVQKAGEHKPDLVLSEIALDGKIDGIEAAHQIYSGFNIPVIFVTAMSDINTIKRAKLVEPYGFIVKPFEEDLLHATIEMALYRHGRQMNTTKEEKNILNRIKGNEGAKTSESGLREDWTRATFIVKKEQLEKIKAVAYWDRKKVKDVIEEALEAYLKDKEIESISKEEENK